MRFLSPLFHLFETMLCESGEIPLLPSHLKRLRESAKALGFFYSKELEDRLVSELKTLKYEGRQILKVILEKEGSYTLSLTPFTPHTSNRFILRERRGRSDLYAFKTSFRPWGIDYSSVFDVIFYDERGVLSEGSRSNIVLEIEDRLYTPRYEGQFLRGIYREGMLERGEVEEAELRVEDIQRASRIYCVNSVRGRIEVIQS